MRSRSIFAAATLLATDEDDRYNGAFDSSRPSILKKALGLAHIANSAMHHEFAEMT
jgi:hypothetical protein